MKLPIKEWEETINGMSYEELSEYISDPDVCYPEFMELAKERLAELESQKESEKKKTRELLLKTLTEIGCQFELTEEGDVFFIYEEEDINDDGESVIEEKVFFASVNVEDEADGIFLYHTHDFNTNIKNETEFSLLRKVINGANTCIDVNTVYDVDEQIGDVSVYSWRVFNYISQMSNFKSHLILAILSCLDAAYLVDISMHDYLGTDNNRG